MTREEYKKYDRLFTSLATDNKTLSNRAATPEPSQSADPSSIDSADEVSGTLNKGNSCDVVSYIHGTVKLKNLMQIHLILTQVNCGVSTV